MVYKVLESSPHTFYFCLIFYEAYKMAYTEILKFKNFGSQPHEG